MGQAGPLLASADEAVLRVVDAQYGGILTDTASVLVVCRQGARRAGTVTAGGTTMDVRLSRARPRWAVTALYPARPGPAVSSLPSAARKVLDDSRIGLPPAARADVRSGHIRISVLEALLRLAETYRMNLSVIRSGHPLDVFGTSRQRPPARPGVRCLADQRPLRGRLGHPPPSDRVVHAGCGGGRLLQRGRTGTAEGCRRRPVLQRPHSP
ncbi:hypothetical protein [Streptomyces sp. JV178]|uniref:hypothetical protein n=1 Tax=Streptomyces sp. JV178 TaxID=858632 RepID=UPI00211EDA8D|nr:hypothetical protein [Streptomyces sp. JV178]